MSRKLQFNQTEEVLVTIQLKILYLPVSYLKIKIKKPAVLCGYESWFSLTLRGFESKGLRETHRNKKQDATGGEYYTIKKYTCILFT